jgi:phosphohistidine phosphatase
MNLFIVRHAWAAERDDSRWPDDDLRPLTDEGQQRFANVVSALVPRGLAAGVIGSSPLVRCRQTAAILAAALPAAGSPNKPDIVELDELRPGSQLERLLRWTARQAKQHDAIAWVGHAPDVDELAAALIGPRSSRIRFAKGAVASIEFDAAPAPGGGELRWLVTAKVLGC